MKIGSIAALSTSALLLIVLMHTASADSKSGKPFEEIWAAITNVQQQVAEIELIPGPQGVPGPKGDKGEPGASGAQLHVVDGSGQDLGILIDAAVAESDYHVFSPSLGAKLRFVAYINQPIVVFAPSGVDLKFEQPNCQGTPFAYHGNRSVHLVMQDPRGGGAYPEYWMYDLSKPLATRHAYSRSDSSLICQNLSVPEEVSSSLFLREVQLPFTEPLAWPLQVKSK